MDLPEAPATVRIRLGINPFTPSVLLLGLTESRVNLLGGVKGQSPSGETVSICIFEFIFIK